MSGRAPQPLFEQFREPRWWLLCLLYLTFVIYGSLVPLEWRAVPFDEALTRFANIRFLELGAASRADWVANIVLYVPLGFLGCAALFGLRAYGLAALLGALGVFAVCVAVAVAVEFTQIFFAPRTVSLNDLLAETIGAAIGVSVWLFGRWRVVRLGLALARGGRASVVAALVLFALAYGLLSLFPFDFVVSGDELAERLASGNHAWLLGRCGNWLRCLAFSLAEVLAVAPAGLLLALLYPRWPWVRFLLLGLGAGLVLELLQLLLVSGKAQGLSVLLRGAGMLLGAFVARLLTTRLDTAAAAWLLRRALPWLAVPYLAALTALSGWWSGPWLPVSQAMARLGELGWVPFYYHYWTSEPVAMTSLLSQLAFYMPVGVAVWAWGEGPRRRPVAVWTAPVIAAALAMVVEAGKLFAPGARPDPTNVLIAPAGAWLAQALTAWFARVLVQSAPDAGRRAARAVPSWSPAPAPAAATPHGLAGAMRGPSPEPAAGAVTVTSTSASPPPAAAPGSTAGMRSPAGTRRIGAQGFADIALPHQALPEPTVLGYLYALGAGAVAVAGLVFYPLWQVWLALALIAFGALLWRWPWLWLAVVPAALPVLDLTPFSGRVLLNAFDLFVLVGLAVAGFRLSGIKPARLPNAWLALGLLLLWVSWLVSMGIGLAPAAGGGVQSASSHPPLAPWHEGKGLLWALLAVPLLRRLRRLLGSTVAARLVLPGAVVGLALVCANVLYERLVHVGAFDLTDVFRVTGPFASMHDGGAYIEAYLAFVFPMLLVWMLLARQRWQQVVGALLVPVTAYAMLVTFSRAGYGAFAVGAAVVMLGVLLGRARLPRVQWLVLLGLLALVGIAAVPVLTTGFAGERLAQVRADLDTRLAHWRHAVGLMDDGLKTLFFGEGFGRYPALYLFSPRPRTPAGTYEVLEEGGNAFVRLGKGEAVYLDQRVPVRAGANYRLTVRLRAETDRGELSAPVCEKALLYSFTCVWPRLTPEQPGRWQTLTMTIQSNQVGRGGRWPHGPVKLSLYNSGQGLIDVDDVSLKSPDGRELIANGGFEARAARWLFVTDQDLAWHIHEQFVETYFAQGLLGLMAMAVLLIAAASVLVPAMRAGRHEAVAFAGALAGFVSVGLLGSTVDAPRTAMLFYLGALCAALLVRGADKRRRKRRRVGQGGDGETTALRRQGFQP
ncbi:VanZ family protein [uncultured Thiohalocapsa sp.]|uniref:VanZ family protein n=1 Tax=uncultured Thiohalocapsa sp. TaxID=768990 RepID=UPI0025EA2AA2|nr:VanZ family protein [uncultured Thiohalocapsa sp.]